MLLGTLSLRRLLIIPSIAITALLAGCGSSTVSATAYAKSVCAAITPFITDVETSSSALNVASYANAEQGKQALERFASGAAADSQHAVSLLKAAGTPDVSNGKTIETTLVKAFMAMTTALSKASAETKSLPTSSPEAFATAAQSLGSRVESSLNGIGSSFSGLKNGELKAAAEKTPGCASLKSAGSP